MVKRSFIALVLAAGLALVMYWVTMDKWVLLGAFLISLHLNFTVLVVTLPNPQPMKKLFDAYRRSIYLIIIGGLGLYFIVMLTVVLVIVSPLYYVIAGRKYENNYGDKSHKARKK